MITIRRYKPLHLIRHYSSAEHIHFGTIGSVNIHHTAYHSRWIVWIGLELGGRICVTSGFGSITRSWDQCWVLAGAVVEQLSFSLVLVSRSLLCSTLWICGSRTSVHRSPCRTVLPHLGVDVEKMLSIFWDNQLIIKYSYLPELMGSERYSFR